MKAVLGLLFFVHKGDYMIRKAMKDDMKEIMPIYEAAKKKMRLDGNFNQWSEKYPDQDTLIHDIERGELYVAHDTKAIYGVFMLSFTDEPTYDKITGKWLNDEPYAVIHRIASCGIGRNLLEDVVNFAFEKVDNIRIDTHEDNKTMRRLLKKLGFIYTGIIYLNNGDARRAYQLIKNIK